MLGTPLFSLIAVTCGPETPTNWSLFPESKPTCGALIPKASCGPLHESESDPIRTVAFQAGAVSHSCWRAPVQMDSVSILTRIIRKYGKVDLGRLPIYWSKGPRGFTQRQDRVLRSARSQDKLTAARFRGTRSVRSVAVPFCPDPKDGRIWT